MRIAGSVLCLSFGFITAVLAIICDSQDAFLSVIAVTVLVWLFFYLGAVGQYFLFSLVKLASFWGVLALLGSYFLRILLVFLAVKLAYTTRFSTMISPTWVGVGVLVSLAGWVIGLSWGLKKARIPIFDS